MASVCFYFQVHQPRRVKKYRVFDVGNGSDYFDDHSGTKLDNGFIIRKVSEKSYLPANAVLLELLKANPEFKVSYSFSGIFLEQLEEYAPETLKSFQELVATGQVEVLSETYYHSLAFFYSPKEFRHQVEMHRQKVKELFGVEPTVFRNTELSYTNELAQEVDRMGFKGILAEGADRVLDWRSPNFLYKPYQTKNLSLLLKNYKLSDDVAFRFSNQGWTEFPLDAEKYTGWLNDVNGNGNVVNLFMDYETFGEHQWADTGIFDFLRALPEHVLRNPDNDFVTPSEAIARYEPVGELEFPDLVSWADLERDLSAWTGNEMQQDAIQKIYDLEDDVLATGNEALIADWRKLQTSDHFYYMCTKYFNDGDIHAYFSPYDTPYEAFIAYVNAFTDLKLRLERAKRLGEVQQIPSPYFQ